MQKTCETIITSCLLEILPNMISLGLSKSMQHTQETLLDRGSTSTGNINKTSGDALKVPDAASNDAHRALRTC